MKNKIAIFISFLTLTLFASAQSSSLLLDKFEKTILAPNVLSINKCANWHVDFNKLKKTVIYSDKIISMGLYGGFVCLDYTSLTIDENFTNKLNSDFFTNVACYNDTLFAEKFDEIFYLSGNNTTWVKYNKTLPVKFFDIIYQDNDYIFYPVDFGEWGSLLFIYDKEKNITKGLRTTNCANAIIKTDGKYLISSSTRHMSGFSDLFSLQKIDNIPVLVDHSKSISISNIEEFWKRNIQIDESNKSEYYKQEKSLSIGAIISSTFLFQNNIYHFIEPESRNSQIIISKNEQGNLAQQDSLTSFIIDFTNSYNEDYIFNAGTYDCGFMILQKNRLIRIKFEPQSSYKIKEGYVKKSGHYETVLNITLHNEIVNQDSIVRENLIWENYKIATRNTNYRINNKDSIYTEHYNENKIFINYQGQEKRLKFDNSNNILRYCFKSGGADFLYFFCLGNYNHKYGLIEITDFGKFVNDYSK